MRRGENGTVREALEWKLQEKKPRERPMKRWIDVVEEDLKILGVEDWREAVQDRYELRGVVMSTKLLESRRALFFATIVVHYNLYGNQ